MNLNTISSEIELLLALTNEWKASGNIPEIEREIALDKLKSIYASLKTAAVESPEISENLANQLTPTIADERSWQGVFYEIPDEVPAPSKAPTPVSAGSPIEELVIPDFSAIVGRRKEEEDAHRMTAEEAAPLLGDLSSLADFINNNAQPTEEHFELALEPIDLKVATEDLPAEPHVTVVEQPLREAKTLSDTIGGHKQLLNETIAPKHAGDLAQKLQQKPITDLRKSISFNEKFQMIKELFAGDAVAYEAAITAFNAATSLDEALIYIHDHYQWNPNSEVANHLIELLQRRFVEPS